MKKLFYILLVFGLILPSMQWCAFGEDTIQEEGYYDRQGIILTRDQGDMTKPTKGKKKKGKKKITLPPSVKNEDGTVDDVDDVVLFLDRKTEIEDGSDNEDGDED